jgi:sec-independent protein translocase protein TatA
VLNGFGWPHLLIIAVLIILLFGAKRLPDAARGLGRSLQIFKSETRSLREDEKDTNPGTQANEAAQNGSGFPNPNAYQAPPQQIAPAQQQPVQPQQTPAPPQQQSEPQQQQH